MLKEKMVLFKRYGDYYITTLSNYERHIQDVRKMTLLIGFDSFEDCLYYLAKQCGIDTDDVLIKS